MYKYFSVFCACFLMNFSSLGQNLEEALTNAYLTNEDLKNARIDFSNNIESFPQALSSFLPTINAEHDTTLNDAKNKSKFSNSKSSNKNVAQKLNFVQPIFNGGSSVAALKAAQEDFRISRSQYYATEQKTLFDAIDTFLTHISNKEKYDITETSVKSNKKQLEAAEEKFNLGEGTRTEIASAKAGFAKAETDRLVAYANYQASRAKFIKIFGIEPANLEVPNLPQGLPKNLDEFQQKTKTANLDLEAAKHNLAKTKANVAAEKGKLLPQVDFLVSNSRNFYEPQTNNGINNRSLSSTVRVIVPIFDRGGTEFSKIRQAKNSARKGVISYDNQLKINNANCISIWEAFIASKSRIVAASEAVEAAQIAYDGTFQEEKVGSKTILDVLDAEDKLFKVKIAKVDAIKENISSAYQMKAILGQLTAKSLKLKVKFFEPEKEFRKTKFKVVGF